MGDFEDVFGAGADAVDIIDGYSRQYDRSSSKEKANWWGTATEEEFEAAGHKDELDAWRASMSARGYTRGPRFSSYDELSEWDRTNKRSHVRRRNSHGFEVYFTDGKAFDQYQESSNPNRGTSTLTSDDEIPF